MFRHSRLGGAVAAAAIAAIVAACSSGAGGDNGGGVPNPTDQGGPTPTPPTEVLQIPTLPPLNATPGPIEIQVYKGAIGTYLTDANGMALYIRTTDSKDTSTCNTNCATTWPPLLLHTGDTMTAGPGVTGKLGTFTRKDGGVQITLNGMPLYYYHGDTAAGQTNGQGQGGVWFLATPDGGHLTAKPASSSGSGY